MSARTGHAVTARWTPGHQRLVLWPHRSSSTKLTCCLIAAIATGLAAPIVGFAAWPLAIPAGATVIGVSVAFWRNNKAARFHEVIDVTPRAVRIARVGPASTQAGAEFDTHWVQLSVETDRYVENRITFRERGRSYSPGVFLAPEERKSLAETLRLGMRAARRAD